MNGHGKTDQYRQILNSYMTSNDYLFLFSYKRTIANPIIPRIKSTNILRFLYISLMN